MSTTGGKSVGAEPRTLSLNLKDNIIVAVDAIPTGMAARGVEALGRIPKGHKMAVVKIAKGEPVLKFGQIIGFASEDIAPGTHIHTQNCAFAAFERDYAFARDARNEEILPASRTGDVRGLSPRERQVPALATTSASSPA